MWVSDTPVTNVITKLLQIGIKIHKESQHQYSCDNCQYKGATPGNLKKHVESIHEGGCYPCDQCDYKATWKSLLKTHVKSTHEGICYTCAQCDYKATQKSNLRTHRKKC